MCVRRFRHLRFLVCIGSSVCLLLNAFVDGFPWKLVKNALPSRFLSTLLLRVSNYIIKFGKHPTDTRRVHSLE